MHVSASFSEKKPCVYGSSLTFVALASATIVALGIITLLANQKMLSFSPFSINSAASIPMVVVGSGFLGAVAVLAVQSCFGQKRRELASRSKENPPANGSIPHSPLNPDGKGNNTGATGGFSDKNSWQLNGRKRKDSV